LGSTNGTKIDGKLLNPNELYQLDEKSRVQLGLFDGVLKFEIISLPLEVGDIEQQSQVIRQFMLELYQNQKEQIYEELKADKLQWQKTKESELSQLERQKRELIENARRDAFVLREKAVAELESEKKKLLSLAQIEAARHLEDAKSEAQKLLEESRRATQLELQKRDEEVRKYKADELSKAASEVEEYRAKILAEVNRLKDAYREEALITKERLLEEAKKEIAKQNEKTLYEIEMKTLAHEKWLKETQDKAKKDLLLFETMEKDRLASVLRAEFEEKKMALNREIEAKSQDLQNLILDLSTKKEQLFETESSLARHLNQLKQVTSEIEKAQREYQKIAPEYEEAKALVAQKGLLTQTEAELKEQISRLEARIPQLEKEFEDKRSELERQLEEEKHQNHLQVEQLKKNQELELLELKNKMMRSFEAEVSQKEDELKKLRKEQALQLTHSIELELLPFATSELSVSSDRLPLFREKLLEVIPKIINLEIDKFEGAKAISENFRKDREILSRKKQAQIRWAAIIAPILLMGIFWNSLSDWARSITSRSVAKEILNERRSASIYTPNKTAEFRETYTDNVLYMTGYAELKSQEEYVRYWARFLNRDLDRIRKMGLSEDSMVEFVAKEAGLVQNLILLARSLDRAYLEQGISRMRALENQVTEELLHVVKTRANLEKLRELERQSIAEFQRGLASHKE
jgi:hypothetical protein